MDATESLSCPVPGCAAEGTLSQVIHHVTERDDESHTWQALGFRNSYEFRAAHESGRDGDGSASEPTAVDPDSGAGDSVPLAEVPGVGDTRAAALRRHGYTDAADVAAASVAALGQTPTLSEATARCVRTTAREACGYPETFVSELADSLDANRGDVADAYADLAACVVEPADAEPSLRALFDDDDSSVMGLSEHAVRFRHFLREAGFERVEDVATADVEELTAAAYVGESRARTIRESARDEVEFDPVTPDEPPEADDSHPDDGPEEPPSEGAAEAGRTEATDRQGAGSAGSGTAAERRAGFPPALRARDQWLLWKPTEDGRKVPRAPWSTGDPLRFVDGLDPANWTSFGDAVEWMEKLPHDLRLAFALTRDDEFVFLDLDDVVVDGDPSGPAQQLLDDAESYAALSTSGTGVHIFGRGSLPEGVKSLTGPLDDSGDQTLEVYDRNRFVAMTGDHLDATPAAVTSVSSVLAELEDEFGTVSSATPDRATTEPRRSRDELRDLETTGDIQDVFDAINQTRPSDISLRSTQTRDHGDGTYSYDPSWTHSESGTRLGVLEDVWIYREGMIALNALQVVALEEGIITDEREHPEGEAFWTAVEALRDRGAHIPAYEPGEAATDPADSDRPADDIDEREVAKRINYGDPVRAHVHKFDRDYQEQLAVDLAPVLADSVRALRLSAPVAYRAAEAYAAGHAAGIVPGASHESTLGAAIRVASIEAGTPRPLQAIADAVDETPTSVRRKFHRLVQETGIADAVDAADLVVDPVEYVPYLARELDRDADDELCASVRELLEDADLDGGSNPMSEVAAAFYVALQQSPDRETTQREVADAAGVSVVTVRNNYRKFTPE